MTAVPGLARYGVEIIADRGSAQTGSSSGGGSYWYLLRPPFTGVAAGIGISAIGVGLITYGFQLWLPTNLQEIGFTGVMAANVLRNSALLGFPPTLIAAWLYCFWSSKKTIIVLSGHGGCPGRPGRRLEEISPTGPLETMPLN